MSVRREITTRTAHIWIDDDDIIHSDCFAGAETTMADAEAALAAIWEIAGQRRLPQLVDMRAVRSVERAARAHLAGPEAARRNLASAILVGSPLSRAIGNFFIGINKTLIPSRLFTSQAAAMAWLRSFREGAQP
ncbi:MAG: STAS/SEC14 domain-containing protein [Minicystis sp.]